MCVCRICEHLRPASRLVCIFAALPLKVKRSSSLLCVNLFNGKAKYYNSPPTCPLLASFSLSAGLLTWIFVFLPASDYFYSCVFLSLLHSMLGRELQPLGNESLTSMGLYLLNKEIKKFKCLLSLVR